MAKNKLAVAPLTIVTGDNGVGKTRICHDLGLHPEEVSNALRRDLVGFMAHLWDGEVGSRWLEHPEAHLHPRLIAVLADHLVGCRRQDRVLYLETHSEVLLRQLYRHIEAGRLGIDDIAFNDVQAGGKIIVAPLQACWVDFIDVWPNAMIVARTYGS